MIHWLTIQEISSSITFALGESRVCQQATYVLDSLLERPTAVTAYTCVWPHRKLY